MEAELCGGPIFCPALLQVPVGDQHRVKLTSESATQGPSYWALPVPAQTALSLGQTGNSRREETVQCTWRSWTRFHLIPQLSPAAGPALSPSETGSEHQG